MKLTPWALDIHTSLPRVSDFLIHADHHRGIAVPVMGCSNAGPTRWCSPRALHFAALAASTGLA